MKPVISHLDALMPILSHQYTRYLPSAFDESMSIVMKMNMVIREMNRLGETTNDVVEQWLAVMEWLTSQGLEDVTTEVLNDWYESGKLETIINEEILNKKSSIVVSKTTPTIRLDSTVLWFQDIGGSV